MTAARWVLHLPTTLTDQYAAAELAAALRDSLAQVTAIDFGETTLSEEDGQHLRLRVWCDARVAGGRCELRESHPGLCRPARLCGDPP